jgi:hypothetical protein
MFILMGAYCLIGVGIVSNFSHGPMHKMLGFLVAVGWVVGGVMLASWIVANG